MRLLNRPAMGGVAAAAAIIAVSGGLSATAATGAAAATADATGVSATAARGPAYATVSGVLPAAAGPAAGAYHSARMSVEVVLAPRNQAKLTAQLAAAYAHPKAGGHWLAKGQFAARFAPTAKARAAAASYLRKSRLIVAATSSPFLMRATGTSATVSAAFRTTLKSYRKSGTTYFANATPAVLPAKLAAGVLGVVGLSNTVREHPSIKPRFVKSTKKAPDCELPYPTRQQFITIAKTGNVPPTGYGAAPGCNGLSPSQENGIYGAPAGGGARTKGQGVTLGLFELSAYQPSDIRTYTNMFFGPGYNPPLSDVNVDGGPLHPRCPLGDTCPQETNGYTRAASPASTTATSSAPAAAAAASSGAAPPISSGRA